MTQATHNSISKKGALLSGTSQKINFFKILNSKFFCSMGNTLSSLLVSLFLNFYTTLKH